VQQFCRCSIKWVESVRHAFEFRDRVEVVNPGLLRANKYLPTWHQFISLAKRSDAHVVGFWLIASRRRIDRRSAVRAESLHTDVSTIGGLSMMMTARNGAPLMIWQSVQLQMVVVSGSASASNVR